MKEKISIGLDVGNRHINMVKLNSGPQGLRLLDVANVELDPRQGKAGKLAQLETIAREKGIAGQTVNIGVSGESVIVRYLNLPKMSNKEVAQALKYEAQQYIPFKMDEVIIDYQLLNPLSASENRMKVLLVAAKKKAIMELVELIQLASVIPGLIDVNAFSLINCFETNGPRIKEGDIFALVNLEFDLVNINILQGQTPYFTRDISLLEDLLSLRQENEQAGLFEAMRPLMANLLREIRLSIDYFESEFEKQVYRIYLSGEGAKLPELVSFFNSQLGREINLWNPLQNLIIDSPAIDADGLKTAQSMLALACGLALRRSG